MDQNGNIRDLPQGTTWGDAMAQGLAPIPPDLVERVAFLTSTQRRAWRHLVRVGTDPKEALAMVQMGP
jgi:hypothetical protein